MQLIRKKLTNFEPDERLELRNLMMDYITFEVVKEHVDNFEQFHGSKPGDLRFFIRHKQYIEKMEEYISKSPNGNKYVPLPVWFVNERIPDEFMVVKELDFPRQQPNFQSVIFPPTDIWGPPENPGPFRDDIPVEWQYPLVCNLTETDFINIEGEHNPIHGEIGGIMYGDWSPAAPIFWPLHAFFTSIYEVYQSQICINMQLQSVNTKRLLGKEVI